MIGDRWLMSKILSEYFDNEGTKDIYNFAITCKSYYKAYHGIILQHYFKCLVIDNDPSKIWNHETLNRMKILKHVKYLDFYPSRSDKRQPFDLNKRNHYDLCIDYRYFTDNISQFNHLVQLNFGDDFDLSLPQLPHTLKVLKFGFHFNQPVDNLPKALEKLRVGLRFNQPINHLPETLICLKLGGHFNQILEKLPRKLKVLKFSQYAQFNQSIARLPDTLEKLYFGSKFNQPLPPLSEQLKYLRLGYTFNQSIKDLPNSIQYLALNAGFNLHVDCALVNLKKVLLSIIQERYRQYEVYFESRGVEIGYIGYESDHF